LVGTIYALALSHLGAIKKWNVITEILKLFLGASPDSEHDILCSDDNTYGRIVPIELMYSGNDTSLKASCERPRKDYEGLQKRTVIHEDGHKPCENTAASRI